MKKIPFVFTAAVASFVGAVSAQQILTTSPYVQNFDGLSGGLPANWTVHTAATATSFGTDVSATRFTGTPSSSTTAPTTNWDFTSGGFRNYASGTGLIETSSAADQLAATNRALGVRQVGNTNTTFPGSDPGAAYVFRFSSTGKVLTELKFDLWILNSQPRVVTYTIDYGVGSSPTTFLPLKTVTDPGAWGKTAVTLAASDLVSLNNQSDIWVRIAVLSATTGTGNRDTSAIDDFSISFTEVSGQNVSRGSGTDFTPTSFGGSAFTPGDTAVFGGTAAAVNLLGNVVANALSFTVDGYTLAGGVSDSIEVSSHISVDASRSATISGLITGSLGLTKIGDGALTISGANTFTGRVSITAGTLTVGADSVFGAAENDISLNAVLSSTASTLALGAGRTLSGSGTILTPSGGTLTLSGPLDAANLTFGSLATLNLGGASNSIANLTFDGATAVNVTGGPLLVTGTLSTAGNTTVTGNLSFAAGTRPVSVPSGTLAVNGTLTLSGGRVQKIGSGTLDLATSTTVAGAGGLQLGVVGDTSTGRDGGTVTVNEADDLGTLQMFHNSGTLNATAPITSSISVSIGGRASLDGNSPIPVPTFSGSAITFSGADSYFFYNAASSLATWDRIAFNVDNTTNFSGSFLSTRSGTTTPLAAPAFVLIGGSGKVIFSGNASSLIDDIDLDDTVTLSIASTGQLGGRRIFVDPGTTFEGAGSFIGKGTGGSEPVEPSVTVFDGGTLSPTGILVLNAGLSLAGQTKLDIGGLTAGTEYDRVSLTNIAAGAGYTLTYGGGLTLNFTSAALNGSYELFTVGTGVTRSGSFGSVALTGSYTGALTGPSGTVWSGTVSGVTFSFDESTGALTVTGGASAYTALETWRFAKFGVYEDTGSVLAGDTEDLDGDGISNLIEYATGTEPGVANASVVTTAKAGDFLTLSFPVISDSSLTYTVQATSDLGTAFTTGGGSTNTVSSVRTYTDNVSLSTAGVRRFLRLQVTYTE